MSFEIVKSVNCGYLFKTLNSNLALKRRTWIWMNVWTISVVGVGLMLVRALVAGAMIVGAMRLPH